MLGADPSFIRFGAVVNADFIEKGADFTMSAHKRNFVL